MKKQRHLDFEIDKLTESIEHVETGESHATSVTFATPADLAITLKKNGWVFNWRKELKELNRQVYKLTTLTDPDSIQGLIAIQGKPDHVYMHLLESAPWNIGSSKRFEGVARNLVAFACKRSFELGHQGNLAFFSKTKLINHYETSLGAKH